MKCFPILQEYCYIFDFRHDQMRLVNKQVAPIQKCTLFYASSTVRTQWSYSVSQSAQKLLIL